MGIKTVLDQEEKKRNVFFLLKSILFVVVFCEVFALRAYANNSLSFRDRLFFGGNFGVMIGEFTDIEVSPIVGYYITPRWAAGIGINYEYYNNKYHYYNERFETHIWGGRLFTNYVIVNNVNDWIPLGLDFRIFLHAEYEALSYKKQFFDPDAEGRELANNFLIGGGLRFPMGRRSSMNLTILWNLNSKVNDFYGSGPILRVGFNF